MLSSSLFNNFLSHLTSLYPLEASKKTSLTVKMQLHPNKRYLFNPYTNRVSARATCTHTKNKCILDICTLGRTDYTICTLIAHEFRHAWYRAQQLDYTREEERECERFGAIVAKKYFRLNNLPIEGTYMD